MTTEKIILLWLAQKPGHRIEYRVDKIWEVTDVGTGWIVLAESPEALARMLRPWLKQSLLDVGINPAGPDDE